LPKIQIGQLFHQDEKSFIFATLAQIVCFGYRKVTYMPGELQLAAPFPILCNVLLFFLEQSDVAGNPMSDYSQLVFPYDPERQIVGTQRRRATWSTQ